MSSRGAKLVALALTAINVEKETEYNNMNNSQTENNTELDIANLEVVFEDNIDLIFPTTSYAPDELQCYSIGSIPDENNQNNVNNDLENQLNESDPETVSAEDLENHSASTPTPKHDLEEANIIESPEECLETDPHSTPTNNDFEDENNNTDPDIEPAEEELEDDPNFTPSNNDLEEANNNEIEKPKESRKKRRRQYCNPKDWEKNVSKRKRMLGHEYIGYTRKDGKVKHDTPRTKRILGPKCESAFCNKAANRFCHMFTDSLRQKIFDTFWNMTWEQKRLYVIHMVSNEPKHRKYTEGSSRRNGTFKYYLKTENEKHQVCKKLFLSTLGLKEKMVLNWVNEGTYGLNRKEEDRDKAKYEKKRGSAAALELERRKEYLVQFLQDQPKMESHYCRQRTAKLYLEQDFKTKQEVYDMYKQRCSDANEAPLSYFSFNQKFDELNLALFKPRKDQCDLCFAHKMKQVDDVTYETHRLAKDQARNEKDLDKIKAAQGLIHCFTMDVQAVKLCPALQASSLYYKTKLQVHNFTIYNLANNDSKNFVWTEVAGELCASVFATCISKHLNAILQKDLKPVIIYSDSCGYQNKNVILANVLSLVSSKFNIDIEQKFLEKGHTNMECDSTHSLIERRLKGRDIYLPTDYIEVIKQARKKPKPLEVEYLDYTYFINYDDNNCMRYGSIRPGKGKNDLKVSDIRCLKYMPNGEIMYKVKYTEPYISLPQRKKVVDLSYAPKPLYSQKLMIKKSKWLHLQEIKKVLPSDTHFYYDSLQYSEDKTDKQDQLQTTSTSTESNKGVVSQPLSKPNTRKSKKR